MTKQAGNRAHVPEPGKAAPGPAHDADDAPDQIDASVNDRIQDVRDDVYDSVDDRHLSRWYIAATGQNPVEDDHGDKATANE